MYHDPYCLSDICNRCYQKLPEQKCESLELNYPWFCKNKHALSHTKPKETLCAQCLKNKLCSKVCKECDTYFCLQCKFPTIYPNGNCIEQHHFDQIKKS